MLGDIWVMQNFNAIYSWCWINAVHDDEISISQHICKDDTRLSVGLSAEFLNGVSRSFPYSKWKLEQHELDVSIKSCQKRTKSWAENCLTSQLRHGHVSSSQTSRWLPKKTHLYPFWCPKVLSNPNFQLFNPVLYIKFPSLSIQFLFKNVCTTEKNPANDTHTVLFFSVFSMVLDSWTHSNTK